MDNRSTNYLFQCKSNYFKGIRPSNKNRYNEPGYQKLLSIAEEYFINGEIELFAGFMNEFQYNINLWTAHFIIEFNSSNEILTKEAIEIIKRYSKSTLNIELANEEKEWLISNGIY